MEGVELAGSDRFELGGCGLTIRGSATWLDSAQQNSAGQSSYSLSGTIFNPAKLNSRVGAVWSREGFTASAFANYTGSVDYTTANDQESTGSFQTFDPPVGYGPGPDNRSEERRVGKECGSQVSFGGSTDT